MSGQTMNQYKQAQYKQAKYKKETNAEAPAKPRKCKRPDPKLQGELVELAFLHKAVSLGFAVAKPYGDSERYDFILDHRESPVRRLWRVQVKSTAIIHQGAYRIWVSHSLTRDSRSTYTSGQIDFIVAHVLPELAWYVFPIRIIGSRTCLKLFPHHRPSRSRYEQYRDAWDLISDSVPSAANATSANIV